MWKTLSMSLNEKTPKSSIKKSSFRLISSFRNLRCQFHIIFQNWATNEIISIVRLFGKGVLLSFHSHCQDQPQTKLPPISSFFFFFFFISADSHRCGSYSGRITLNQAISGETSRFRPKFKNKKKKKKKVQNAPFELNNIPYFSSSAHFIQTSSSLTLSHFITHLSLSLCSRLSTSVSALRLPYGCETLSQIATQSL